VLVSYAGEGYSNFLLAFARNSCTMQEWGQQGDLMGVAVVVLIGAVLSIDEKPGAELYCLCGDRVSFCLKRKASAKILGCLSSVQWHA
jgi:hypothetical protein